MDAKAAALYLVVALDARYGPGGVNRGLFLKYGRKLSKLWCYVRDGESLAFRKAPHIRRVSRFISPLIKASDSRALVYHNVPCRAEKMSIDTSIVGTSYLPPRHFPLAYDLFTLFDAGSGLVKNPQSTVGSVSLVPTKVVSPPGVSAMTGSDTW